MKKRIDVLKLTEMAILIAIVVVAQLYGGAVKIGPTSISLVLIPIVLGGIMMGPFEGALLGLVFGVITLVNGLTAVDPFTATLLNSGLKGAIVTPIVCLGKATLAGWGSGIVYKMLKLKNELFATFAAAAAAPIINTGMFIIGMFFLSDVLTANFVPKGTSVIYFLFIGVAGLNFLVELAVNMVAAPTISRIVATLKKGRF